MRQARCPAGRIAKLGRAGHARCVTSRADFLVELLPSLIDVRRVHVLQLEMRNRLDPIIDGLFRHAGTARALLDTKADIVGQQDDDENRNSKRGDHRDDQLLGGLDQGLVFVVLRVAHAQLSGWWNRLQRPSGRYRLQSRASPATRGAATEGRKTVRCRRMGPDRPVPAYFLGKYRAIIAVMPGRLTRGRARSITLSTWIKSATTCTPSSGHDGRLRANTLSYATCLPARSVPTCARSSMDRVLPSEGRGCWFDPSRARQTLQGFPLFLRHLPFLYGRRRPCHPKLRQCRCRKQPHPLHEMAHRQVRMAPAARSPHFPITRRLADLQRLATLRMSACDADRAVRLHRNIHASVFPGRPHRKCLLVSLCIQIVVINNTPSFLWATPENTLISIACRM